MYDYFWVDWITTGVRIKMADKSYLLNHMLTLQVEYSMMELHD